MDISSKVNGASKWSLITEIVSKLMAPITNMVLARLLAPEAFGMVATVTMVTSFADIFTDAGFQKFLVQREFRNAAELDQNTNVAFWTNFALSVLIWGVIACFRHSLAALVGNPGLGNALMVASMCVPMTSFSSIQMARFRRDFDFKTLFFAKLVGIFVPVFVTIPLAFLLKSYWALIVGTLAVQLSNAVLLTLRSKWKPGFFFSLPLLKEMMEFSIWTLTEQLLGWANLNAGIFIVGQYLSSYYLGLYKTSMASANQIMSIIVYAASPVLLSALSRLKMDAHAFKSMFYDFEEKLGVIIIPLGIGIYVYKELLTKILLGSQWAEATSFIGLWGLMRAIHIVFGIFTVEVFVSLGKPKYSVLTQILELVVLLPVLLITAPIGYQALYVARSMVVFWCVAVEMVLLRMVANISPLIIVINVLPYIGAAILMGVLGNFLVAICTNIIWQIGSALICSIFYFGILMVIPKSRKTVNELLWMVKKRE